MLLGYDLNHPDTKVIVGINKRNKMVVLISLKFQCCIAYV